MGENQKKILQMLAEGKITVEEATRLLSLVGDENNPDERNESVRAEKPNPKYLYVKVDPKEGSERWGQGRHDHGKVNVRIPLALVRAGMKLTALMPPQAADDVNRALKEKGIGFDIRDLRGEEYIEQLVGALSETEINVDSEDATVTVYAQ